MDDAIRELVRRRAGDRCEYCRFRQEHLEATLHVEHIVAKQHGGTEDPSNLALACIHCNLHKGPNLAGIDPVTGQMTSIFNPRRDVWAEHFTVQGSRIFGLTPVGRTTLYVLAMNSRSQIELRAALIPLGLYP